MVYLSRFDCFGAEKAPLFGCAIEVPGYSNRVGALVKRSNPKLSEYAAKRDFAVTSEPAPAAEAPSHDGAPTFMVHKHDANRLHYDIRLEMDGALASWACPKGPSYDPAQKRLAVQTEDHPLAYADFEGRIPDGEYGAGDSIIWDRGTYETVPPHQELEQRKKGHLHIVFHGQKLDGGWHFVRTRPQGSKDQWLVFKAKDGRERAGYDVVAERPESVKSGRTMTRGPTRQKTLNAVHLAPGALLDKVWPPMLAKLAEEGDAPEREYVYEQKYDGFRAVCAISGRQVAVRSRNNLDLLGRFPFAETALKQLVVGEAVLDAEIVSVDERGVSSFSRLGDPDLQQRLAIFDLLWLEGDDLRERPLEQRRELLESLLAAAKPPLLLAERVSGSEAHAFAHAKKLKWEGLIAKRRGSTYEGKRSSAWLKLKLRASAELAIAGWTDHTRHGDQVGALLLARRDGKQLVFSGKVGTGFDAQMRKHLFTLLSKDEVEKSQVDGAPRYRNAHWVKPKHLAQLEYGEWTGDGRLRHPSFAGLREDKSISEVDRGASHPNPPAFGVWHSNKAEPRIDVPLTHGDRILFPKTKITKASVRAWYDLVAPWLVPVLNQRPLSIQQWPQGIAKPGFFRHTATGAPQWVTQAEVVHETRPIEHIIVDRPETLSWLANQSALTLHMPASRLSNLDTADWVTFDLDPAGDDWEQLVPIAHALHGLMDELKLTSVPKTSGKRGLHVLVPITAGHSHERVHAFAAAVTGVLAAKFPELATTARAKNQRKGRLYLDAEQNARLKTVVAPYSLRALEGAPVSAPLEWDEVSVKLKPASFTIATMAERLAKKGDLFGEAIKRSTPLVELQE
jgi:bifunctional non-homologous end joining protein LigD